jgi:hypothetical protein
MSTIDAVADSPPPRRGLPRSDAENLRVHALGDGKH